MTNRTSRDLHNAMCKAANASQYLAMAWASNQTVWTDQAIGSLEAAAEALGYNLVKRPTVAIDPATIPQTVTIIVDEVE